VSDGRVIRIEKRFLPDDPKERQQFALALACLRDAIRPGRPRNEDREARQAAALVAYERVRRRTSLEDMAELFDCSKRTIRRLAAEGERLTAEQEAAAWGGPDNHGT
jgi:hypothetical protein